MHIFTRESQRMNRALTQVTQKSNATTQEPLETPMVPHRLACRDSLPPRDLRPRSDPSPSSFRPKAGTLITTTNTDTIGTPKMQNCTKRNVLYMNNGNNKFLHKTLFSSQQLTPKTKKKKKKAVVNEHL